MRPVTNNFQDQKNRTNKSLPKKETKETPEKGLTISERLQNEIELAISDTVEDLISLAEKAKGQGNSSYELSDTSLINVTKILWEVETVDQMKECQWLIGYLASLFDIVDRLDLRLSKRVADLKSWSEAFSHF